MQRINEITLICGRRGTGKTTIQQNILMVNSKKTLVVDTFDHPSWQHFPIINIEQLKYWKNGNYRIILSNYTKDLIQISNSVNNCNIVYEDAKKYFNHSLPQSVINAVIDSKQKNTDIYIMYHALSQIPKFLREMYDNLVLFKTKDSTEVYSKFSNPHEIQQVHQRVMKHKSNFYCEYIKE